MTDIGYGTRSEGGKSETDKDGWKLRSFPTLGNNKDRKVASATESICWPHTSTTQLALSSTYSALEGGRTFEEGPTDKEVSQRHWPWKGRLLDPFLAFLASQAP